MSISDNSYGVFFVLFFAENLKVLKYGRQVEGKTKMVITEYFRVKPEYVRTCP